MSEQEKNEYMKDVRWKTALYTAYIFAALLISGTGGVYILKADIKGVSNEVFMLRRDNKADNRELHHYVDSLHHDDITQFHDVWNAIHGIPFNKAQVDGCIVERIINGRRVFVPTDCK